jgi:hypothetical protein
MVSVIIITSAEPPPITAGWSKCYRAGFAPARKLRLSAAHKKCGLVLCKFLLNAREGEDRDQSHIRSIMILCRRQYFPNMFYSLDASRAYAFLAHNRNEPVGHGIPAAGNFLVNDWISYDMHVAFIKRHK